MELYRIFRPITAHFFICSEEYAEWEPLNMKEARDYARQNVAFLQD